MASESNEENSSMENSVTETEKTAEKHDNKEDSKNSKEEKDQKNKSDQESESESESDENEEMMGLLDRPVEITGCRARKQVERLEYNVSVSKDKHDIPEGTGQKLGDCPRIEQHIQKTASSDLKSLHRILFGRAGSANEIKKNIRKFSGFTFTKNSTEFEHKKSLMEKLTTSVLKNVCEIIDIERSGSKDDLIMRILEFLLNPKESGKRVVSKKKPSNKEKKKNSDKKVKNKKPRSKKTSSENVESSPEEESEKSESEKEDNENDKKVKVTSKPVKSKAKKDDEKVKDKKVSKGTKRKRDTESSEEEEPVSKKTKEPSDEDIKNLIKKILDNADLHEITMKKVIKQVGEHYPQIDLSLKKPFIKETIKSVIS